jgi:hemerythrin
MLNLKNKGGIRNQGIKFPNDRVSFEQGSSIIGGGNMDLRWNQNLVLGLEKIDEGHKKIIGQMNKLLELCEQDSFVEPIRDMVEFLHQYVSKHFTTEEQLAKEYHWPLYTDLRERHRYFKKEFLRMADTISNHGVDKKIMLEMNFMLVDWFIGHINNWDRKLVEYLKTQL